jgi:hypothetical protein
MVFTHDVEELFSADCSHYSVNFQPAFDPLDIALNSGLSLIELRDVTLARAEEEDAREIARRIPRSEKLKSELIDEAGHSTERTEAACIEPIGRRKSGDARALEKVLDRTVAEFLKSPGLTHHRLWLAAGLDKDQSARLSTRSYRDQADRWRDGAEVRPALHFQYPITSSPATYIPSQSPTA